MSEQQLDIFDSLNAHIEALSPKQKKFLKVFGECGVVKYACRAAGVHRSSYYHWRDSDEHFAACLPYMTDDANETLEYSAYQQGAEGISKPLVSLGQPVYEYHPLFDEQGNPRKDDKGKPLMKRGKMLMVQEYSPQLLITLLKARMPEKYKEKQQLEISGDLTIKTQWGGGALIDEEDEEQHENAL